MTLSRIMDLADATWPSVKARSVAGFTIKGPDTGGNRVSAARLTDGTATGCDPAALDEVETFMTAQHRAPLVQELDHQTDLSAMLDARGYVMRDATDALMIEAATLAEAPPPVTAFDIWPPLAIQTEIWEANDVDAARRAVMDRAICAKTSIFGRINDKPAGSAFVGCDDDMAMVHALVVDPVGRRAGLASVMMRAAALWAVGQGATWLSVLVTQENKGAQRLYSSLGLKPVGTYRYREMV